MVLNTHSLKPRDIMSKGEVEFLFKGLIRLELGKITSMTNKSGNEHYSIYLPLELDDLRKEIYQS
jgi:hypothetical protein